MSKKLIIDQFVNNNINSTFKTSQICQLCNISLPTLLAYIKQNPTRFTKIKHGIYTINASIASIVHNIVETDSSQSATSNHFDWD